MIFSATRCLQLANEFISNAAKTGMLLRYVVETGEFPHGLNQGTRDVWEAMCAIGLVKITPFQTFLTPGGEELLKLADRGEF